MKSRLGIYVLLAGLLMGCGAVPVAQSGAQASPTATPSLQTASPTPSATASPSAIPSPQTPSPTPPSAPGHLPITASTLGGPLPITCSGTIGASDPVAIVTLHGQTNPVLRDFSDPAHPRNVCSFGSTLIPPQILNPHYLVVQTSDKADNSVNLLVQVPSVTAFQLKIPGEVAAVAPDFSQVLWYTSDFKTLHDTWDTGDVIIQRFPTPNGGRCGSADYDSRSGAFTRSGSYGYALQNIDIGHEYLNVVGNRVGVFAETAPKAGWGPLTGPSMAVWSPVSDTLYYRQQGNIWRWTPSAGAVKFRAGVNWIDPSISPDGRYIVYMVRASNGTPTVHLMNAATGRVLSQLGGPGHDWPFFLTNNLIWFHSDVSGCVGLGTPTNSIYDLNDHTETASAIDSVSSTWPATSALGG